MAVAERRRLRVREGEDAVRDSLWVGVDDTVHVLVGTCVIVCVVEPERCSNRDGEEVRESELSRDGEWLGERVEVKVDVWDRDTERDWVHSRLAVGLWDVVCMTVWVPVRERVKVLVAVGGVLGVRVEERVRTPVEVDVRVAEGVWEDTGLWVAVVVGRTVGRRVRLQDRVGVGV